MYSADSRSILRIPVGFPSRAEAGNSLGAGPCRVVPVTFGVRRVIRCDKGKEFGMELETHLCRWLHADIMFGPADHPRGQAAVQRRGGWLQELLAELCQSWPERWDEHVSPAIWTKRTLPDASYPSNMTPFELMFGRKPRTSLDSLVPLSEEAGQSGGLDNALKQRKQGLRGVRLAFEKRLAGE